MEKTSSGVISCILYIQKYTFPGTEGVNQAFFSPNILLLYICGASLVEGCVAGSGESTWKTSTKTYQKRKLTRETLHPSPKRFHHVPAQPVPFTFVVIWQKA